jgi:hypothetical protein
MLGSRLKIVALKAEHRTIITIAPEKIPIEKEIFLLNPYLAAFDIDNILFGPGVNVVIIIYDKKAPKLGIITSLVHLYNIHMILF